MQVLAFDRHANVSDNDVCDNVIVHGTWLFRMLLYLAAPSDKYSPVDLACRIMGCIGIVAIDITFSRADREHQR